MSKGIYQIIAALEWNASHVASLALGGPVRVYSCTRGVRPKFMVLLLVSEMLLRQQHTLERMCKVALTLGWNGVSRLGRPFVTFEYRGDRGAEAAAIQLLSPQGPAS